MALSLIELLYKKSRINKNLGIQKYAPNQIGTSGGIVLTNSDIIQFDKNGQSFLDIPKEMPAGFDSNNLEFERKITDETGGIIHNLERPVYQEEINRQIHDRLSKLSVQDRVLYERSLLPECCPPLTLITGTIEITASESSIPFHTTMVFGNLSPSSPNTDAVGINTGLSSGSIMDIIIPVSSLDSSSVSFAFYSGSIVDVIYYATSSESSSVEFGFYSGSIVDVIYTTSVMDSASVSFAFYSGSIHNVVIVAPLQSEPTTINVGLLSGSLS